MSLYGNADAILDLMSDMPATIPMRDHIVAVVRDRVKAIDCEIAYMRSRARSDSAERRLDRIHARALRDIAATAIACALAWIAHDKRAPSIDESMWVYFLQTIVDSIEV